MADSVQRGERRANRDWLPIAILKCANISKRLVKTPKVYVSDVGLLCRLIGLHQSEHARNSPMSGTIIETAVINEVVRTLRHRGVEPRLYFWRTATSVEVDAPPSPVEAQPVGST